MPPNRSLHRRSFLRLASVGTVAASLGLPASARNDPARSDAPFSFVVVNDLHYRDERCTAWFQRVVARLAAMRLRPAFVMLAGDLSEDGTPEQLAAVQRIFAALPMPVRTVIGNHDYTLAGERAPFERFFGPQLNYHFAHGGCQFVALDTTQKRSVYRTHIPAETFTWLDATLPRLARAQPTIILTHFPLGQNWLRPLNVHQLLDRFRAHQLLATFSGHWHGLTERTEGSIHLSTSRCCSWWRENHDGSPEKGYTECHVNGGAVQHAFVAV